MDGKSRDPARISTYLRREWRPLLIVTITGILYNIGMIAGPWFEGQMAQCLADIIGGSKTAHDMAVLALLYAAVIGLVQGSRFLKRLYVRKFANHINRDMKKNIYHNLVSGGLSAKNGENQGSLMTKAVDDVDDCVEGIRKFTTEIFDTGVVMIAYIAMLLHYDVRLTLIVLIFPPVTYFIANKLKKPVTESTKRARVSMEHLNEATMDRVSNALTYRVYGQEENRGILYEQYLQDYECKSIRANIFTTVMQPLYQVISLTGALFIILLGSRNVLGTGWVSWNIAAFSTFIACYGRLSEKSSHAAKLFNAVQKARVSWVRIEPFLHEMPDRQQKIAEPAVLTVEDVSARIGQRVLFEHVSFTAQPGQIIGITGAVASGKTIFGKMFLPDAQADLEDSGTISYGGAALSQLAGDQISAVGYMGHQPELFSGSIADNICMGREGDLDEILQCVCLDTDLAQFPDSADTLIGGSGARLSGGQTDRVMLARTFYHERPVIVLDDPFSAVDPKTESRIFANLKQRADRHHLIILLISHRLAMFPQTDGVLFLDGGQTMYAPHGRLYRENGSYRRIYDLQTKGGTCDA